jgi:DNA repair exonuclease SbcCD ATPase subunit
MHITKFEVIDFKRIEVAAITPEDGKPIVLTGDNAQGKSSILDAVMFALTRTGSERSIRNGAESSAVALTLSDGSARTFTVKRKIKGNNAYLDITTEDGMKMPSPQKFLDGLIGNLAFDPEAFTRLKPKEQAEALRKAVGLDTSDLDEAYKTAYSQRTEANRVKDNAEKIYKACPIVSGAPKEIKSASDLVKERDTLQRELSDRDDARESLEDTGDRITAQEERIKALEAHLIEAREKLATFASDKTTQETNLSIREEAVAGHDARLAAIEKELEGIDAHNADIENHNRNLREREQKKDAYQASLKRYNELDTEVKRVQAEKETRIAAAAFPIPGLAIEDDTVLVNNVPFSDLNTAERIKVSTLIAMAQNPDLKVIFVREGALVSRANLALLADLAKQHEVQLWMEVFSEEPHEDSIHITDGHVSHINGTTPPANQLELI